MKRILVFVTALSLLGAATGLSAPAEKASPVLTSLSSVPVAELPAKAAALVKNAKGSQRGITVVEVTRAAISIKPASAPAIVGAIAKAVPPMAALSAGAAAEDQPNQAVSVAKAAAAAAPAQADEIVVSVCRAVPNQYRAVAVAVSQVAPGSSREILRAVAKALPELKPGIDKALSGNAVPSVVVALDSAQPATQTAAAGATQPTTTMGVRGPVIAPPYQQLSGTPTNINPSDTGEQPSGGRNYATP